MKEQVTSGRKRGEARIFSSGAFKVILSNLMYAVSGFMLSVGAVFGAYAPFGASIVAAVPFRRLAATVIGTVSG